jgi:Fe-S cluster biogenesis protein NfuA
VIEYEGISMITVTPTPNPDAYVFQVQETLIPSGTHEFFANSDTSHSLLATKLLTLDAIELIMIAPRFITVRKFPESSWSSLADQVETILEESLKSGELAVSETEETKEHLVTSDVEAKILSILQSEVRPAIAQDGGDFIYHGFENGIVKLELIGACGTCPSSTATLHYGIQNLLMEEVPEVTGVEQIHAVEV